MNPVVTNLFVGQVRQLGQPDATDPMDRPWATGMFKEAVDSEIWLSTTCLDGDQVSDTKNHGGPDKAILAYSICHYDEYWSTLSGLENIAPGGMGENLAVHHATEDTICLGDIFRFHGAIIQVSQPRQPCWKPARRFRMKDLALRTQQTGRTGWYFRVLQEGYVKAGAELTLVDRPSHRWTVSLCNRVMHHQPHDLELTAELASHPNLARSWKQTLENRLAGAAASAEKRLFGQG